MGDTRKIGGVSQQKFATPHRSVCSVTGAVPGHTQGGSFYSILGQTARQVGVVMLDGDERDWGLGIGDWGFVSVGAAISNLQSPLLRPAGRCVIRMHVVSDCDGGGFVKT